MLSTNPFNQEVIHEVRQLTDDEIREKVGASAEAFKSFRGTSFSERASRMQAVAELLRMNSTEYARVITLEMGKLLREAKAEVEKCAWVCDYFAEHAEDFLAEELIETEAWRSSVIFRPLGPLLAVMPWNFPFWQVFRFAAPNLMAGNTILLKHASNVQGCAGVIEKVFRDAGYESALFQNLPIGASRVETVIAAPAVRGVTLTGSKPAGQSVASLAGRYLKKSVLELGGNNAFVVLKDADIQHATDVALQARLQNAGQSCIAAKRFLIDGEVCEEFVSVLQTKVRRMRSGDPQDPSTDIAPLFSIVQADEIDHQVKRSLKEGATLVTGGTRHHAFYAPTILEGVRPGMPVFDEETFGPVFAVTRVKDAEEALELANRSEFGLGIQVFTRSEEMARLFIEGAEEGAVFINEMVKSDPRLPFGGVKDSGFGRELAREGIREFVNIKTIAQY